MFGADKFIGKLQEAVQGFELPKFGTEVEIPVYVVHNSLDAEDYFFIFDFEISPAWYSREQTRIREWEKTRIRPAA